MDENIKKLQQMVDESHRIVFFGGAGVSTESGIPDFRSVDGLYNQKFDYPPETILSHSFFVSHTAEFLRFLPAEDDLSYSRPNAAHRKLAELEAAGKLTAVITQNIDGLHQMAGSKRSWNCTAAFTAITAKSVISAIRRKRSSPRLAFPVVPVAVSLNPMLSSMRNSSIAKRLMKA